MLDGRPAASQDPAMAQARVSVEELLLRHRAIDDEQLRRAKNEHKRVGGDLGQVLVDMGYVSEELLLRAQSHQLGIPLVNLDQSPPPRELAQALTEPVCRRFGVIPVSGNLEAKLLRVATSLPGNLNRLITVGQVSGFRIEAAAATAASIERAIQAAFAPAAHHDGFGDLDDPAASEAHPEIHPELDDLDEVRDRLARLEKMLSNPQFAALLARVERLEQIAERDHKALNAFGQLLLDLGLLTREEMLKRLGRG